MAAASSFNGFTPSEKFYDVCSVQPEFFEQIVAGPEPRFDPLKHLEKRNRKHNLTTP